MLLHCKKLETGAGFMTRLMTNLTDRRLIPVVISLKMSQGSSVRCPRRVSIHNTFIGVGLSRFRGLGNIARDNGGKRFKIRVTFN